MATARAAAIHHLPGGATCFVWFWLWAPLGLLWSGGAAVRVGRPRVGRARPWPACAGQGRALSLTAAPRRAAPRAAPRGTWQQRESQGGGEGKGQGGRARAQATGLLCLPLFLGALQPRLGDPQGGDADHGFVKSGRGVWMPTGRRAGHGASAGLLMSTREDSGGRTQCGRGDCRVPSSTRASTPGLQQRRRLSHAGRCASSAVAHELPQKVGGRTGSAVPALLPGPGLAGALQRRLVLKRDACSLVFAPPPASPTPSSSPFAHCRPWPTAPRFPPH